ncbi:MAG: hypothetical protein KC535_04490 [Nanoarchaeota archaeon]|nr:hypothetical protein [Nanoarchaeota archaeon]
MVTKKSSKKASKKASPKSEAGSGKACAVLQYFFPIGQIWYLADENMKKNALAKFHLKQSLVLLLAYILVNIVLFILPILWPIGQLFLLFLWIMGLIHSIKGEQKEIPLIGKFASHFTF